MLRPKYVRTKSLFTARRLEASWVIVIIIALCLLAFMSVGLYIQLHAHLSRPPPAPQLARQGWQPAHRHENRWT